MAFHRSGLEKGGNTPKKGPPRVWQRETSMTNDPGHVDKLGQSYKRNLGPVFSPSPATNVTGEGEGPIYSTLLERGFKRILSYPPCHQVPPWGVWQSFSKIWGIGAPLRASHEQSHRWASTVRTTTNLGAQMPIRQAVPEEDKKWTKKKRTIRVPET